MKSLFLGLLVLLVSGCTSPMSSSTPNNSPNTLSTSLSILHNELYVTQLETMVSYYKDFVGMDVISLTDDRANMGNQGKILLSLIKNPQAAAANPRGAGLYHIAYLFKDKASLTSRLSRILQYKSESFEGSSDHKVSEAFYFHDPENNGIELYLDKDPATREWQSGSVVMGSSYIDPVQFIQTNSSTGSDTFSIGHNHLQVGDIAVAKTFYHEILGFDITSDMYAQGALFVSVGGYHHHFGLNTRNSLGAGKRPFPQLGLGTMSLQLATSDDLERLTKRLSKNNISFEQKSGARIVQDPWGNVLEFTAKD